MLSWGSIPNNPILHIKLWKSTLIHKDFQEWEKRKSKARSLWYNPNRGDIGEKGASSEITKGSLSTSCHVDRLTTSKKISGWENQEKQEERNEEKKQSF